MTKALSMCLRLWSLAIRFVLIIFLARYLPVQEVGLYGLVASAVALLVYVAGLEVFASTTRSIITSDPSRWRALVKAHLTFICLMQIVVLPVVCLFFLFGSIPWHFFFWMFGLLCTEHLSTEIDRLLVAMQDQLGASFVVFIRQGLMPSLAIPVLVFWVDFRSVELVFALSIVFNAFGFLAGLLRVRRLTDSSTADAPVLKMSWIIGSLHIAAPFFVGSMVARMFFSIDRQFVGYLGGLEAVAVYSLAMTMATGLSSVVGIGVHQFNYPQLVRAASTNDASRFRAVETRMWWSTSVLCLVGIGIVAVLGKPVLVWIGKPEYLEQSYLLTATMVCVSFYNLSMVSHYVLYARRKDRSILICALLSGLLWVFAWTLTAIMSVLTVAIVALAAGCISLFVGKLLASRLSTRTIL